jgi:2-polyprenyl-3-methyl-5-hydroxy-6-metoxy-1,4-benzoquinol methylase
MLKKRAKGSAVKERQDNRLSWNAATKAHNSHRADQAKFLKNGGSTLFAEEIYLLGDVNDSTLLHLMCNSGQDSLSLAASGAIVTGVDISDEAINFAKQLSIDSEIQADFYCSDVYDWFQQAISDKKVYDIIYTSYGVLHFLSDLDEWALGIVSLLKNNGKFVLIDFHPFIETLNWRRHHGRFPYFGDGTPITFNRGITDYIKSWKDLTTPSGYAKGVKYFKNPHKIHYYQWGLSQIVSALLNAGLNLEDFCEYSHTNGAKQFRCMTVKENRTAVLPEKYPNLPLMFSLVLKKKT